MTNSFIVDSNLTAWPLYCSFILSISVHPVCYLSLCFCYPIFSHVSVQSVVFPLKINVFASFSALSVSHVLSPCNHCSPPSSLQVIRQPTLTCASTSSNNHLFICLSNNTNKPWLLCCNTDPKCILKLKWHSIHSTSHTASWIDMDPRAYSMSSWSWTIDLPAVTTLPCQILNQFVLLSGAGCSISIKYVQVT